MNYAVSREAVSRTIAIVLLVVGFVIGFGAFYAATNLPARTITETVTSVSTTQVTTTSRVTTTTSILQTQTTNTNTVTSTLTSTAYLTSTGQQGLLSAQQNLHLLVFRINLPGPSYNFTVSVINNNAFNVTVTSLQMCTIRSDGTTTSCQSVSSGQNVPAHSNLTTSFSEQARPDPGPLGASVFVTLQTPYGIISQGPVEIYPVPTYVPGSTRFLLIGSNFLARKSGTALALASPPCTPNTQDLTTLSLQFMNKGAPTAVASISIVYGGGIEKVTIANPTLNCAVDGGQIVNLVFTGIGTTPASAGEQFIGTVTLVDGEMIQFTGAFYP